MQAGKFSVVGQAHAMMDIVGLRSYGVRVVCVFV